MAHYRCATRDWSVGKNGRVARSEACGVCSGCGTGGGTKARGKAPGRWQAASGKAGFAPAPSCLPGPLPRAFVPRFFPPVTIKRIRTSLQPTASPDGALSEHQTLLWHSEKHSSPLRDNPAPSLQRASKPTRPRMVRWPAPSPRP